MRVYQALRSTLVWSLAHATSRPRSNLAPPIVAHTTLSRLSSAPMKASHASKMMLRPKLIKPQHLGFTFRRRSTTGRVLLELRAGASSNLGLISSFKKGIQASKTKSWLLLILSICNETVAVTLIKKAHDAADPRLMAIAVLMYVVTLYGFALSLTQIDVGIAYAAWSALGTAIVSAAGILFFHESHNWKKIVCLACIILGVVGLNLLDEH